MLIICENIEKLTAERYKVKTFNYYWMELRLFRIIR